MSRPMYMELKPSTPVKAKRGTKLRAKTWEAEAALRMFENNIDPANALIPDELIVYGDICAQKQLIQLVFVVLSSAGYCFLLLLL